MKKLRKNQLTAMVLLSMFGVVMTGTSYAYDEYHDNYTLNEVVVTAKNAVNRFGDTKTEQSYYRTGGDVKVITRDEIEKRHYADLTDAIKRVPGVTFQNPGYRGGEYGYQFYNNGVAINGDTRVVVLVDGRRVDNSASTRLGSKSGSGSKGTGVNLDQITDINNVDKIEVIKGSGASVYGSDATGGVINIITRQGGKKTQVSVDLGYGNWNRHKESFTYSGPVSVDEKTRVFIQGTQVKSGDSHYIDGDTKQNATLTDSEYKEKGADVRVTRDFDDQHSLDISFNYKSGRDGYPLSTPMMRYWNEKDWKRNLFMGAIGKYNDKYQIIGTTTVVGADNKEKNESAVVTLDNYFYAPGNVEVVKGKADPIKDASDKVTGYNIIPTDPAGVAQKISADQYINASDGNVYYGKKTQKEGMYKVEKQRGQKNNPGYENIYAVDAASGAYSKFNNKDLDVTYTFKKDHNLPSFVRGYYQHHYFGSADPHAWFILPAENGLDNRQNTIVQYLGQNGYVGGLTAEQFNAFYNKNLVPFPGDKKAIKEWIEKTHSAAGPLTEWHVETNYGLQGQYAKVLTVGNKRHDIIAEATYDMAKNSAYKLKNGTSKESNITRNTLSAYVQDKIHMTKDWLLTPAIRFVHFNGITTSSDDGIKSVDNSAATAVTGALNTEFNLTPSLSGYVGITNIYRPLRPGDYALATKIGGKLDNEKGMVYTLGFRKFFNQDKTTVGINYAMTDMSNAIASLPVYLKTGEDPEVGVVNAKDRRQAFNITVDHNIGEHWMLSAAYTHMTDKWSAKGFSMPSNYEQFTSASDINTQINKQTPKHRYSLNVAYTDKKLYTGLLLNLYAGNNLEAFTARNFFVVDWSVNYAFTKNLTAYMVVNNVTNTAYQTVYNAYNGRGAASMPARNYMFGVNYKF